MAGSGYSPSPRPDFVVPTQIPKREATRHLWGDVQAGIVADHIYTSTARIHTLVFGLAAGHSFRHSEEYRTVFGADELLHVLAGTLVLANPETGDVVRVRSGGSVFFRKDTWHHAFAHGGEPLRVLEFSRRRPPPGRRAPTPDPARTSRRLATRTRRPPDRIANGRGDTRRFTSYATMTSSGVGTTTCSAGRSSQPSTSRST